MKIKKEPLERPTATYDRFQFVDNHVGEEKEVVTVKAEFEPIDKSSIKSIVESKVC